MRAGTLRMRISPWLRDLFRRKLFYLPDYRSLDFENRAETDIKKWEESIRRHVRSLGGRGNMARFIFSGNRRDD